MRPRQLLLWLFGLFVLPIVGCGGKLDPVNEGKDRPIPPPKQEKDKNK